MVDENKTQDLLLRLIEDMAIVKSKLDVLDDLKVDSKSMNQRIDHIEAQNERHDDSIKKLEHRADSMEQFTRNQMSDSKKQMMSVYISMGLALFSAAISFVINLF